MHKVPENLYLGALEALKNLNCFEPVERYSLKRVAEAGSNQRPIEDKLIRAAQAALDYHSPEPPRHVA